jgi:ATP-dependent DNA helicase RecG
MSWDEPAVMVLIDKLRAHRDDFTSIEVKLGVGGCPDLSPTSCAFGNMPGGGVIMGVEPGSRSDAIQRIVTAADLIA